MEYTPNEEQLEDNQAWFETESNLVPSDIRKPFNWDLWLSPKAEKSPSLLPPKQSPSPQKSPQDSSKKRERDKLDIKELDKNNGDEHSDENKSSKKRRRLLNEETKSANGELKSGFGKATKSIGNERWKKELLQQDLKDQKKQYKKWLKTRETHKDRRWILLGKIPPQPMKALPEQVGASKEESGRGDAMGYVKPKEEEPHPGPENEDETVQEEFYKAGYYDGITYKIGDWIGLHTGQRYNYGIIRYFFKTADSDIYVYVTELTLIGTGPPYSYKSFTYGDEAFFPVTCIHESLKMLKARYL